MTLRARLQSPAFFRIWVGYASLPILAVVLFLAARAGWIWALMTVLLYAAAWLEASTGLCARCTHLHCGLHGRSSRRIFGFRAAPLSRPRKILHLGMDLALSAWAMAWLWAVPVLGLLGSIWLLGAAYASYPWSAVARENSAKYRPFGEERLVPRRDSAPKTL